MKRTTIIYLLLVLLFLPPPVSAQKPGRSRKADALQPASADYGSLAARRSELAIKESSLESQLDQARELFTKKTPGRETLGASIVELENRLFAVRGEIETLSTEIEAIERERGLEISLPFEEPAAVAVNRKAMLVDNDYFMLNLTPDDYTQLKSAQGDEPEVEQLVGRVKGNYDRLAALQAAYCISEKGAKADSIYSRIKVLAKENESLDESIDDIWSGIFDTKVYSYNYILDKNGEKGILSEQERQMNNLLLLESEIDGEYMYGGIARYALRKLMVTGYEIRIADHAGLPEAADSLIGLVPPTSHIEDFFLPPLDTRERMFYDYADARIVRPARYTTHNRIPLVEVFPRGTMYRILLGAYSNSQQVAVFRGVYPLSRELKADKKHYYYAGGYATYTEAEEAAARLKKQGFRKPSVVAWHDGMYNPSPGTESDGGSGTAQKNERPRYRVEITGAGENLSRIVRDVVSTQAAGKEISRTNDPATGEYLFVVGWFNNKALAQTLADTIGAAEPGLVVRIIAIQ